MAQSNSSPKIPVSTTHQRSISGPIFRRGHQVDFASSDSKCIAELEGMHPDNVFSLALDSAKHMAVIQKNLQDDLGLEDFYRAGSSQDDAKLGPWKQGVYDLWFEKCSEPLKIGKDGESIDDLNKMFISAQTLVSIMLKGTLDLIAPFGQLASEVRDYRDVPQLLARLREKNDLNDKEREKLESYHGLINRLNCLKFGESHSLMELFYSRGVVSDNFLQFMAYNREEMWGENPSFEVIVGDDGKWTITGEKFSPVPVDYVIKFLDNFDSVMSESIDRRRKEENSDVWETTTEEEDSDEETTVKKTDPDTLTLKSE